LPEGLEINGPPDREQPVPVMNPPTVTRPPDHMPDPLYMAAEKAAIPPGAKREGEEDDAPDLGQKMLKLVTAAEKASTIAVLAG
jgi:hypothetical protein